MAETASDFRIVVAIDLKDGTDRLLAAAERYGRAFNAIVNIIHVTAPDPDFVAYIKTQEQVIRDWRAKELRVEHQQTQALGVSLRAKGIRVDALTIQGATLTTILDETRKLGADLLILGSHHHSVLHRIWHGEMAVDAVRQAPCTLLVVPIAE